MGLEFLKKTPQGDSFVRLVTLIQELLPGNINYKTLEDSVRHLAGTPIDERTLDAVCWRLAGNHKRLRQRRAVPPWHSQKLPEWVPSQVVSCRRERTPKGRLGARYGFRILAGTPAGLTAYKWWSMQMCRFMSGEMGFSRPNHRKITSFPYAVPEQLVGMRLYVRIMPEQCTNEPGFDGVGFPSSLQGWNKTTVKCRVRAQEGFSCKLNKRADELHCYHCPIGFINCRAGTHRMDWVEKDCPICEKKSFFDPESQGDACVDCFVRSVYRGDK